MTQLGMFDGDEGQRRAGEGMDSVLRHGDSWARQTRANVVQYLRTHRQFCSDDLYRHNLMPYPPHHDNAIGAFVNRLVADGYIEYIRHIYTKRAVGQSRKIGLYGSRVFR